MNQLNQLSFLSVLRHVFVKAPDIHQLMQEVHLQAMLCELFQSSAQCDQDLTIYLVPTAMPKRYSPAKFYEHLLSVHRRPSAMHVVAGLS